MPKSVDRAPAGTPVTVVAVQLGPTRPRWLKPMLVATVRDGYKTILVTDNQVLARDLGKDVPCVEVAAREVVTDSFRQGFWTLSTQRFAALAEAHRSIGGEIIHIESDVRLAPGIDFSVLGDISQRIAYPLLAPGRGSGAVVYLRNVEASSQLATHLSSFQKANQGNDMEALWDFWQRSSSHVRILPCVEPADDERLEAIVGAESTMDMQHLRFAMSGIFDAASYGQFIFGTDGRNDRFGRRRLGRVDPSHFAQPQASRLSEPLRWPIGLDRGNRLLSLHVHSKDVGALGRAVPSGSAPLPVGQDRQKLDAWALGTNVRGAIERRLRRREP